MGPLETTEVGAETELACCWGVVRFERREAIATFLDVERASAIIVERVYIDAKRVRKNNNKIVSKQVDTVIATTIMIIIIIIIIITSTEGGEKTG